VPEWWGIDVALPGETVTFHTVRESEWNDYVQPELLVQLLWREEALAVLERRGEDRGVRTKARKYVCQRLALVAAVDELRVEVREALKVRPDWRRDPLSPRSGGCDPTPAISATDRDLFLCAHSA